MRVDNGYQSAMRGQQVVGQKGGHITRHAPVYSIYFLALNTLPRFQSARNIAYQLMLLGTLARHSPPDATTLIQAEWPTRTRFNHRWGLT